MSERKNLDGNATDGRGHNQEVLQLLTRILVAQSTASVEPQPVARPTMPDSSTNNLSLLYGFIRQQRAERSGHVPGVLQLAAAIVPAPQQQQQQLPQQQSLGMLDTLHHLTVPTAFSGAGSNPVPYFGQLNLLLPVGPPTQGQRAAPSVGCQLSNILQLRETAAPSLHATTTIENLSYELAEINQAIAQIQNATQASGEQVMHHQNHHPRDTPGAASREVLSSSRPHGANNSLRTQQRSLHVALATDPSNVLLQQAVSAAATAPPPTASAVLPPVRKEDGTRYGESFPIKLYRMTEETEASGKQDIFSFTHTGNAVKVHKPKEFCAEILPSYFRHRRMDSFQRQLSLYGFQRIQFGPQEGAYTHPLFIRGQKHLCQQMKKRDTETTPSDVEATAGAAPSTRRRRPQQRKHKPPPT